MNITGNTILITGGTSGIGRALAEAFHAKKNRVIVAGRRQQLLDELTQQNPGMVGLQLDVNDRPSIDRFVREVKERFPALNVLINNAGVALQEDYTAAEVDVTNAMTILQTNVTSVLQLTAGFLPLLKSQPHATLMVTTSGLAFVPFPPAPTYSASKAFLHNWLEAVRVQLRNSNVELLELAPPYVQTELGGPQQAVDPRAMPLSEFVAEVMQLIEENKIEKGEILVERVKPLRWAEKSGAYDQMLKAFGSF